MTDATELDEAAIRETWLRQCGPCDAGLPMACVCSDADPRPVIERLLTALDEARVQVERLHFDLDREARARQAAEQERDELSRAAMSTENGAAMLQHYVAKAQATERGEGHIVHVTVEPVAEDAVWCDECEEWVTSGAPERSARVEAAEGAVAAVREVRDHYASPTAFPADGLAPVASVVSRLDAALATPTTADTTTEGDRA